MNLAHEADASLNDGLPSNLSSYRVETVRIHENKSKTLTTKAKPSTNSPKSSSGLSLNTSCEAKPFLIQAIERWSSPPCDPLLEIPGELVYSLDRRGRTDYWAAKVEQYLPPKTPSLPPKYRVRFKDDTFRIVSRDMFYSSDEPEFYTCKVSQYSVASTDIYLRSVGALHER